MRAITEPTGTVYALPYVRVSGAEHQREGLSLDYQEKATRAYVNAQTGWQIHAEYRDIESGAHDDRTGYQSLLAEARKLHKEGKRTAVVVVRLDRFGRDLAESARARKELRKLGCSQHSVKDGGVLRDTQAPFLMAMSEVERELIRDRIRDVRGSVAEDGWFYGRVPFGYRLRPATQDEINRGMARRMATPGWVPKVFEPDPLTAPVAVEVFERASRGETIRSIAQWLSKLPAELRGNRSWPHQSVTVMLGSPTYVGRGPVGDPDVLARPLARWQALVSDELWAHVQPRLVPDATRRVSSYTGAHLLTGFIKCDVCGTRMVATAEREGRGRSYRCQGGQMGAKAPVPGCNRMVSMRVADQLVLSAVQDVLRALDTLASDPGAIRAAQAAYDAAQGHGEADRIKALETEIADCARRINANMRFLADGIITPDAYQSFYREESERQAAAESELQRLSGKGVAARVSIADMLSKIGGWSGALEAADMRTRRGILSDLISRCVIRRGERQRQYTADITWTEYGAKLARLAESL